MSIFGIFNSGVTGLMASQAGITVTGHNISNVNTSGYSRQVVSLSSMNPTIVGSNVYGRGVQISSISRVYDEILAESLRNNQSELTYYNTLQTSLSQVTVYFNELESGSGLGEAMRDYFNAWEDLANNPTDQAQEALAKRITLVETASTLSIKLKESDAKLEQFKTATDTKIKSYTDEINLITENLAYLNGEIAKIEALGTKANDYRDQRDQLLTRLSNLANVTVHEKENSQITVYLGGSALVDDKVSYKLFTEPNSNNDGHYSITWGTKNDTKGQVDLTSYITGGSIGAELKVRDEVLSSYQKQIDELAVTIINETNRLHSLGQGVERFTQITSNNSVANTSYVFNDAPGSFPTADIQKGTLRITVYDAEGKSAGVFDVDIDPSKDNLNSVIQKLSASDGDLSGGLIQASLSSDNTVKIFTQPGYTFSFTEDTSNFLVAAGLNSFFSGTSASDIDVSTMVKDNNLYISTGKSGAVGDNTIAKSIANLKYEKVFDNKDVTIDGFYSFFVASIASEKHQIDIFVETKSYTLNELELKMEEIHGVSMDEELTNLIKFQRSYEASARFITTVDSMIDKLINSTGLVGR